MRRQRRTFSKEFKRETVAPSLTNCVLAICEIEFQPKMTRDNYLGYPQTITHATPRELAQAGAVRQAAAHRKWFREQVAATQEAGRAPLSQAEAKAETEKRMIEKYGPRP